MTGVNSDAGEPCKRHVDVSIIVPVGKEGETLYERIVSFKHGMETCARKYGICYELILISDVPHTPTIKAMLRLSEEGLARCLFLTRRIGKGGSIKNAIPYAGGDYIVLLDADIPITVDKLCETILYAVKHGLDLVVANRVYRGHTLLRRILSIAYNCLVNMFFRTGIRDHQAGFKVLSRRAAISLLLNYVRTNGFAYDTELIVWAKRFGYRYGVVDVVWREKRSESTIPPIRVSLTMLIDLIILGILITTRKRIMLQKQYVGKIIELPNWHVIGREFKTTIKITS